MDLGRVWFRYQKTMLITMMMFKLGKTQSFTALSNPVVIKSKRATVNVQKSALESFDFL